MVSLSLCGVSLLLSLSLCGVSLPLSLSLSLSLCLSLCGGKREEEVALFIYIIYHLHMYTLTYSDVLMVRCYKYSVPVLSVTCFNEYC